MRTATTYPTTVFIPAGTTCIREGRHLELHGGEYQALGEFTDANGRFIVIEMAPACQAAVNVEAVSGAPSAPSAPALTTGRVPKHPYRQRHLRSAAKWTLISTASIVACIGLGAVLWTPRPSDYHAWGGTPQLGAFTGGSVIVCMVTLPLALILWLLSKKSPKLVVGGSASSPAAAPAAKMPAPVRTKPVQAKPPKSPTASKQRKSKWGNIGVALLSFGACAAFGLHVANDHTPGDNGGTVGSGVGMGFALLAGFAVVWLFLLYLQSVRHRPNPLDPNVIAAELRAKYGRAPTIEEINALHAIRSRQQWQRAGMWAAIAAIAWGWHGHGDRR